MQTELITKTSVFHKRFYAWSSERFPMANLVSGALSYITIISIGRFIGGYNPKDLGLIDLLGAVAFTGHLLLLRIFDEHKDYKIDIINHPDRALSKGLITLSTLKKIARPLPMLSLIWSLSMDSGIGVTFYTWLIMFLYTLLMSKEFFCGEWLSKRLILYSVSHMLVSPFMLFWILAGGMNLALFHPTVILVLAVSLTAGLSYELIRKTRGTDESLNLDAFNKQFSLKGSIFIASIFNIISLILGVNIIQALNAQSTAAIVIFIIGYTCTIYPTINFLKKQSEKARKINEGGIGLFMLGMYVSFLVALFI